LEEALEAPRVKIHRPGELLEIERGHLVGDPDQSVLMAIPIDTREVARRRGKLHRADCGEVAPGFGCECAALLSAEGQQL
jgi:hypothetical protein